MVSIDQVKLALRISTNAFDSEIELLMLSAEEDLKAAGVEVVLNPLVDRAIITYCKLNFGSQDDYEKLKRSYDEQKAQLRTYSPTTDWGEEDGQIYSNQSC